MALFHSQTRRHMINVLIMYESVVDTLLLELSFDSFFLVHDLCYTLLVHNGLYFKRHTISVISVLFLLCFCARLIIDALWSPAGKRLTFGSRL